MFFLTHLIRELALTHHHLCQLRSHRCLSAALPNFILDNFFHIPIIWVFLLALEHLGPTCLVLILIAFKHSTWVWFKCLAHPIIAIILKVALTHENLLFYGPSIESIATTQSVVCMCLYCLHCSCLLCLSPLSTSTTIGSAMGTGLSPYSEPTGIWPNSTIDS